MTVVLDACAIIAYLRDEPGADLVESALFNEKCVVHAINLCEVYKDCLKRGEDRIRADELLAELSSTGLRSREDMDEELWKHAAVLKSKGRIALADCFALAITDRLGANLYSSDRSEFGTIASEGHYKITFIR